MFVVSLADVALEMGSFLVFCIAKNMRAFVFVLALVSELVSHKFNVVSELLAANGARQMTLTDSIFPVLTILRNIRSNGNFVPVESYPILDFWKIHEFRVLIAARV